MNASNCTDDQLHAAVYQFLRLGPSWTFPVEVKGKTWGSTRAETKAAFAERFPQCMEKLKIKKGR